MWHRYTRRNTTYENSFLELSNCIQNYRKHRERLLSLIVETIQLFNGVSHLLNPEVVQCFDIKSLVDLMTDLGIKKEIDDKNNENLKIKSSDIENPVIAVIGQVNAGKSTFVNVLLKRNVVPQSFDRCTARITRLLYSDRNYIEIINLNGDLVSKHSLKTCKIPKKYVQLSDEDRKTPEKVNQILRGGMKVKFLECGIDIIDSPGMDENSTLKNLSKCVLKSDLPIVIYIIDGQTSVKETDVADLLELKTLFPNLKIFYFVTHLDTEEANEFNTSDEAITLAEIKMRAAFTKLQYYNFIPASFNHYTRCPYFHGASLSYIIDYSMKKTSPEILYHFNQYCKFQSYLQKHISVHFENKITEACDILMNFQMVISVKIINFTQNFALKTKENIDQIATIKKIEGEMYKKIKDAITDSQPQLVSRLVERLKEEKRLIIDPIENTIYPSYIQIPENGIVDDPSIIDQCQTAIMKVLIQGLEDVLKIFVEKELFENYKNAIRDSQFTSIAESFNVFSIPKISKSPYQRILTQILNKNYKVEPVGAINNECNSDMMIEFMNVILSSIKIYLNGVLINELKDNEVDVKSPEWKLKQAEECLKHCNHHLLAEDVCKNLFEDFEIKHEAFLRKIQLETFLLEKKIVSSERIRMQIVEKTPNFFVLFLHTLNIIGQHSFNNVQEIKKIGRGAQGEVYQCVVRDKEMALKKIDLSIYKLENISEEIFYSQQYLHEYLLPTYGISISEDEKQISIFYPLKKNDLSRFMKYDVFNKENAWKISIQVAQGLKYLHDHDVVHRDLKLTNILIDDNEDVVVADYGFCKSLALNQHLQCGIPIHIAPEILVDNCFNKKNDIYSFGILLWHLFEGTGKIPRNANFVKEFSQIVWSRFHFNSTSEMRPEKLTKFPDKIWKLMNKCWAMNPEERPDIDCIIDKLEKHSQMRNTFSSKTL